MEIVICAIPAISSAEVEKLARSVGLKDGEAVVCTSVPELESALRRHMTAQVSEDLTFRFPTKKGVHILRLSQVGYFSGENHHIVAHLEDGTELYSRTVRISTEKAMKPLTDSGRFVRVGRTCFVNVEYINLFAHNCIFLRNGESLPVSRSYGAKFRHGIWAAEQDKPD